jgi:predicted Zn-dependent protease
MGVADKMWDAITTVIKMNDRVERMATTITVQQQKIESLAERVIRLETMLEIGLTQVAAPNKPLRRISHKE